MVRLETAPLINVEDVLKAEEDEQLHGVADNSQLRPDSGPLCGVHPSGIVKTSMIEIPSFVFLFLFRTLP